MARITKPYATHPAGFSGSYVTKWPSAVSTQPWHVAAATVWD